MRRLLEQSRAPLVLVAALSHVMDRSVQPHLQPATLTHLATQLDELVQLQSRCGLTLRLCELEVESRTEVGLRLLDAVPSPELLFNEVCATFELLEM